MPRLDSVTQTVRLMRQDLLGDDFRKHHAEVAREEKARVIREAGGSVPLVKTFVDGREGASEDSVKLYGVITYTFGYVREIAAFIMAKLREFSPVDSGLYRDSHFMLVNGREAVSLDGIGPNDEIAFSNTQPYSRKIEVAYKGWYLPGHVYQRTVQAARARFGDVMFIEFTFRAFIGGTSINQTTAAGALRTRQRDARGRFVYQGGPRPHNVSNVRYPVIVLHQR